MSRSSHTRCPTHKSKSMSCTSALIRGNPTSIWVHRPKIEASTLSKFPTTRTEIDSIPSTWSLHSWLMQRIGHIALRGLPHHLALMISRSLYPVCSKFNFVDADIELSCLGELGVRSAKFPLTLVCYPGLTCLYSIRDGE